MKFLSAAFKDLPPSEDWLSPLLLNEAAEFENMSSANLGSGFIPFFFSKKTVRPSPFMWNTGSWCITVSLSLSHWYPGSCVVLGHVWYLIVLIPDLCTLTYLDKFKIVNVFLTMIFSICFGCSKEPSY